MMLRKMFSRVLHTAAPTWKIREASNGETALTIAREEKFDLIFIDQYMAAVEKQWLGTETVAAMRAAGIDCIICGLSANDVEDQFLEAGANAFMYKPFPCRKDALTDELLAMTMRYNTEQAPPV
jgi:CheY-like chemotaxis protein